MNTGNTSTGKISARNMHTFEALGLHLAYDIGSVKVYRIDALAAAIIQALRGGRITGPGQLQQALPDRYPAKDIAATLQALFKAGLAGPEVPLAGSKPVARIKKPGPGGLNKLVLAVTGKCNLRCKYCLSTLEPGEQGHGMTLETGRAAIDLLLRGMKQQTAANIVFYGGEPLLNFKVLKEIFYYARRQALANAKTFTYTVITNGTLLTPEIMDFLAANRFTIGLSLDGGRGQHDANRVFADGSGSFGRVIRNYRELMERGADVTPQAVLSASNPDILEVIRGFQREGVVNYKLIPRMLPEGDADVFAPGQFRRMVKTLLEEAGLRPYSLPIDMFQMMNGIDKARKSRFSCSACSGQLAISADGGVYPCDNFLYTPGYRLASVTETHPENSIDTDLSASFSAIGVQSIPQCQACWAKYLCGGPCPYYSQRKHGRIDVPVDSFCRHKRDTIETTLAAYALCKSKDKDFIQKWVKQRFDSGLIPESPSPPDRSNQS